jgi:prepilin-type N-terminal cleavage/methylation domain-containing protein
MKKKAFSLIELSVVLVVISMMIYGALKGVYLIKSTRIVNARSITSKSHVAKIDGLIAWYETSMIESLEKNEVMDASQISAWYDSSPSSAIQKRNKLTKTADTSVVYESDGINNVPSLYFSGSGKISIANFYQGKISEVTIFVVFRNMFVPSNQKKILLDSYSGNDRHSVGIQNDALQMDAGGNDGSPPAEFTNGKNYVLCAYFNGSSTSIDSAYINEATNMAGGGYIGAGSNALTGLTIGADKNGNSGFTGFISEVIIYNKKLKIDERKSVMTYLSKKYKINVSGL